MAEAIAELGAAPDEARRYVEEAAEAWTTDGHLLPCEVQAAVAAPATARRRLGLDELRVEIAFHGDATPDRYDAVFGQFLCDAPGAALQLVGMGAREFLLREGEPLAATSGPDMVAQLKALLTELYVEAVGDGFLAHGGLLTRGRAAIFLSGAPGAGKTTLTLGLTAAGWAYGGDDIVRFDPDGRVRGAPFSAAVKSGAWPILRRVIPAIDQLPVALRSDGQTVRYWRPPVLADRAPRPLTAVVLLDRTPGAAARLEPAEPVDALRAILEGAYAARWRPDGEHMAVLAERLDAAACVRLTYSDLDQATAALEALA